MVAVDLNARPARLKRVQACDLTKVFGATPALRGANLTLNPGEITILSGPNGAGKSTLLNILGTQLRPTRGTVQYLDEQDRTLSRQQVRACLGWVSHASHCYAELSGRQNIELAAELQGVSTELYKSVASRLGLGRFAERPMNTLSRGQTQRVALGRALIHGPSLLLLDEPWTGLDRKSGELLEEIVKVERDKGALIAIVSHEAGLAQRLSAREVRILRGRVEA
jgi:heme exporter protein A